MKKIAIVTKKMVVGGIEKSLLNMLKLISNEDMEITIFLVEQGGELDESIPNNIAIKNIGLSENLFEKELIKNLKTFHIKKIYRLIINRISLFKNKNLYSSYVYATSILPNQKEEYDLAIAYHTAISLPVIYTINNIKANKKVAWIHSDLDRYSEYIMEYKNIYERYNKIFCVSKDAKYKIESLFSLCKDKVEVYYNCINGMEVRRKSKEFKAFNDDFSGTRIVTVGRLSEEKGQLIIPEVVSDLIQMEYDIKWYLVGEGELRKDIEEDIVRYGVEKELILLGNKINPYPYISECNIYVQTSITEGYCLTISEAKCCYKQIVSTEVTGAKEQIDNNINGMIVNRNKKDIVDAIVTLIDKKDIGIKFEKN